MIRVKVKQVESCLNQPETTDDRLDTLLDLSRVPRFAFRDVHVRPPDGCANPFPTEDFLESRRHVVFAGINGKDLTAASLGEFCLDPFDQSALFRVDLIFRQVAPLCDEEPGCALQFRIKQSVTTRVARSASSPSRLALGGEP